MNGGYSRLAWLESAGQSYYKVEVYRFGSREYDIEYGLTGTLDEVVEDVAGIYEDDKPSVYWAVAHHEGGDSVAMRIEDNVWPFLCANDEWNRDKTYVAMFEDMRRD